MSAKRSFEMGGRLKSRPLLTTGIPELRLTLPRMQLTIYHLRTRRLLLKRQPCKMVCVARLIQFRCTRKKELRSQHRRQKSKPHQSGSSFRKQRTDVRTTLSTLSCRQSARASSRMTTTRETGCKRWPHKSTGVPRKTMRDETRASCAGARATYRSTIWTCLLQHPAEFQSKSLSFEIHSSVY